MKTFNNIYNIISSYQYLLISKKTNILNGDVKMNFYDENAQEFF